MTENTDSMETESNPETGLVFHTFPEHLYQLGETVCQALDIADDFTQNTGLVPDVGSVTKDAALHTLSMMSYTIACSKGYQGAKEEYLAQALAYYTPMLEQYIKHEKLDPIDDEIEVA